MHHAEHSIPPRYSGGRGKVGDPQGFPATTNSLPFGEENGGDPGGGVPPTTNHTNPSFRETNPNRLERQSPCEPTRDRDQLPPGLCPNPPGRVEIYG